MADYPALPLWTDAYLADTDHLTLVEHGAYFRLLMLMWRSPSCRIPNDPNWIIRRLRIDLDTFENVVKPVIDEFCTSTGNWITQKRLSEEIEYLRENSKTQSARAKSRWKKEKGACRANAGGTSSADAQSMPPARTRHRSGNAPTPTPTPTPQEELSLDRSDSQSTDDEDEFELWYRDYPRKVGRGQAERAFKTALKLASFEDLVVGRDRYAAQVDGKDPQFIKHPATWLNGKCWLDEDVAAPAERPNGASGELDNETLLWRSRIKGYRDDDFWLTEWGPAPDQPDSNVPPEVLRDFGYAPQQPEA